MQCPVDGETLVMTERSGVEIDYCPKCRGVWLDRGELDKILERASAAAPAPVAAAAPVWSAPTGQPTAAPDLHREPQFQQRPQSDNYRGDDRGDRRRDHDHYDDNDHHRRKPKRRESFLSDLFDF